MCDRSSICPNYKSRVENGILSGCGNCEYLKKADKKVNGFKLYFRIALAISAILFGVSTYYFT